MTRAVRPWSIAWSRVINRSWPAIRSGSRGSVEHRRGIARRCAARHCAAVIAGKVVDPSCLMAAWRRSSVLPWPRGPGLLAAVLQGVESLGEDRLAVLVVAPLTDVGQVGLVGLGLRGSRRVVPVLARREPAPRAVPDLRDL